MEYRGVRVFGHRDFYCIGVIFGVILSGQGLKNTCFVDRVYQYLSYKIGTETFFVDLKDFLKSVVIYCG